MFLLSLSQVSPNLDFWSDASDVGRGAHLGDSVVSDLWSPQETGLSINVRKLLAVENGLHYFTSQLVDSTVAVFIDNSTAIAYLRNQGGTRSPLLNSVAQRILRWVESVLMVLAPQFIKGKNNVLADSLSRPNQVQGLEWTLKQEVFLLKSPMFSIFFALPRSEGFGDECFSSDLGRLSGVCLSTFVTDTAGSEEAPNILWSADDSRSSLLASKALVSRTTGPHDQWPCAASSASRSSHSLISIVIISGYSGCPFMCGDSPAICQVARILFMSSQAGWFCSSSFISCGLPV